MRKILIMLCIFTLTGCVKQPNTPVHHNQNKHPEPHSSFFDFLFPHSESKQSFHAPGTYTIRGQTYKVLTSANGYRERGSATWYGRDFHNKRTSSGERYNMYGLTAAHRTLPLQAYVKVTNLKNGRSVVVRINDRGPFHSNRLIDLSYAAAKGIGMLPSGMAQVEIQVSSPQKLHQRKPTKLIKKTPRRRVHHTIKRKSVSKRRRK